MGEAATLEAKISVMEAASTDVFEKGMYGAASFTVKASKGKKVKASPSPSLPVDVFVVTPTTKGMYPVLLFCHGWMMTNEWYSTMFEHITSHGYIIVAPQFYSPLWSISVCEEIERAKGVVEWLSTGLLAALEKEKYNNIYPDVDDNLIVSGHSRGGKVAFALALGAECKKKGAVRDSPLIEKFKAVVGIDPVAGRSPSNRPDPKILSYIPRSFNMSIPVAVVGTGKGNQPKGLIPPCAPDKVNHAEFFNESKPPIFYFVAKEFGHFDMMNDNAQLNFLRTFFAASGKASSRGLMIKAVAGGVVAFLRNYLVGREEDLNAIVDDPTLAPIVLEPVCHVEE